MNDTTTIVDDINGIAEFGVMQILDPADVSNGKGVAKVPADETFYDTIEWLKEQVGKIDDSIFFTPFNTLSQTYDETMIVFLGANNRVIMIPAQSIVVGPAPGASARTALEIAYTGKITATKAYPGFLARHPTAPCPVGAVWPEIGGQRYHFADGVNPAEYPVRKMEGTNDPIPYKFFIDGEWLAFERINVPTAVGFKSVITAAWRLVGR